MGIDGLGGKVANEQGRAVVLERLLAVNDGRNLTRTIAYDKGKEDVSFISQSSTGVSDILENIKAVLVSYADYPTEQLFEESKKQSMGSGMSNQLIARMLWASRLVSWINENWSSNYTRLFNTIFGEGYKLEIPFNVEMTELEKAEIEEKGANRLEKLLSSKVININEARTGYKTPTYRLNIDLDENFELKENEIVENPESKTEDNQQENQIKENTENIDAVPNNDFWETLSEVTEDDLISVAKSVLTPGDNGK
jgi:hypothetical protein